MSSQFSSLFSDPKFLGTYFFGLITIVLYAKDKFNMPTYDRTAMGPFAQLPPQSLTMDQRYRHGRTIYVFMLVCLYTAVCIVGPSTFPDLFKLFKEAAPQYQLGPQIGNKEIWPVAAATFLISTGASNDGSILGKVEYFIRQYAHKTAYIPRTVRDLARYFREIDGYQWLTESRRAEESSARRSRLVELAGKGAVAELEREKQEVSGELMQWIRANIFFYTLERLFKKTIETVDSRIGELTDLPANNEIFIALTGARRKLYDDLVDADGNFQPGKAETGRFAKDASLMLAVLLSQGARNQTELDDYIKRIGLAEIHFHPSDSSTFVTAVNVAVFVGVIFAGLVLFLGYVGPLHPFFDLTGTGVSKNLAELARSVDIFPWLAMMINATLSYLVAFRVLVYCRDTAMESRDWSENLASRFRVISIASSVSSVFSVVVIVLFFAIINKLPYVMSSPVDVVHLLLLQFVLSLLLSSFGLAYLRQAPLMPSARSSSAGLQSVQRRWLSSVKHPLPWAHALCAAVLVAMLGMLASINVRNTTLDYVRQAFDQSLDAVLTNQRWIKDRLTQEQLSGEVAEPDRRRILAEADTKIGVMFNDLKRTPLGPMRDLSKQPSCDAESGRDCGHPGSTTQSLRLLADICTELNAIPLSDPPGPSAPRPDCSRPQAPAQPAAAPAKPNVSAGAPPGQNNVAQPLPFAIPFTLFKDPNTCAPYERGTMVCAEGPFLGLGQSLSGYYQTLQLFENSYRSSRYSATTITPALTAFIVAFAFGVGCLACRAGWLREGLDEPQGKKLIAEIKQHYPFDDATAEASLAVPLKSIGGLTPLEALRYEEFGIKLLDLIKDDKNPIEEFVALKPAPASGTGAASPGSAEPGGGPPQTHEPTNS